MDWHDRLERLFPWGLDIGVSSMLWTVASGIGLIVSWAQVADQGVFSRQVGWLAVGVLMLMVSLYGHAALVTRARRRIGARRASLISESIADLLPRLVERGSSDSELPRRDADSAVQVVDGLELFHIPGCAMTSGRTVTRWSKAEAVRAGFESCGICGARSRDRAETST
jgi:hypothetical protein